MFFFFEEEEEELAFSPPSSTLYKVVKEKAMGLLLMESFLHRKNVDRVEVLRFPNRHGMEIMAIYVRYSTRMGTWKKKG